MPLLLEDEEVRRCLSMGECIQAMEEAFREFALGIAPNRPRVRYACASPTPGLRYSANVHCGAVPRFGTAAVWIGSYFRPEAGAEGAGARRPVPRTWGLVMLYSLATGELLAILHDFSLSAVRVGATTGLAARYLAREDSRVVGLLGSGKQARTNLEGLCAVRPIERVRVYSPNPQHRRDFAAEMGPYLGVEVVPADGVEAVVRGCDILCCATNSPEPVFDGRWLEPGQLVITLGNSDVVAFKTEADEESFVRSDLIVINDRESVYANQQRELLGPIEAGRLTWERVRELGQIVAGQARGREGPQELIYYKSNSGLAIQFAAAGAVVYRRALQEGLGRELPSEWFSTDLSAWHARGYQA